MDFIKEMQGSHINEVPKETWSEWQRKLDNESTQV